MGVGNSDVGIGKSGAYPAKDTDVTTQNSFRKNENCENPPFLNGWEAS